MKQWILILLMGLTLALAPLTIVDDPDPAGFCFNWNGRTFCKIVDEPEPVEAE